MIKIYSVIKNLKEISFLNKITIKQGKNARWIIIWSFYDNYINFEKDKINNNIIKINNNELLNEY